MFKNVFNQAKLFGSRVIEIIRNVGVRFNKKKSGKTLESLTQTVTFPRESEVKLEVWGSKVFKFIEEGREAGAKMPPKGALLDFMAIVGIPAEKEFAVRRSIAINGIEPVPLLKTSFLEIERDFINNFTSTVGRELSRELAEAARRGFTFGEIKIT